MSGLGRSFEGHQSDKALAVCDLDRRGLDRLTSPGPLIGFYIIRLIE